ncbi:response regulator [Yoonia sediminilitoris]|uniref:LuxR family two component transcriptional regulator n=1 Tax=Yoonia sediminilitoris TaxID=1286148 RepID=A0A2T6KK45_9RHOB|nr:response regulator transcription factor [Yoonia sediminilitoris]PUB16334.1 LuxR family two component transcriptional regulator [Yoonia sediminilitoris]RCW96683.1 LuxR family two component transcriptional regulator [Yoonia sediminilitoris]
MAPIPDTRTAPAVTKPPKGWALIIDDHPLFCDALELTLRALDSFTEVRTADCMEAGLRQLEGAPAPDLILLDLNLPDVSGLDGLIRIKRCAEQSPVLIVSSMTDNAIIIGAIAAGASGFVPKHSGRAVFKEALAAIATNTVYKPPGFVEAPDGTDHARVIARLSSLTNQQGRILELICQGKLNKQIAYDLSIAEGTVKAHVTAIMRKLGVQRRTQAVLVAQEARFFNALPKIK